MIFPHKWSRKCVGENETAKPTTREVKGKWFNHFATTERGGVEQFDLRTPYPLLLTGYIWLIQLEKSTRDLILIIRIH